MFDKVCEASPWFVRHFTRNGILKGLRSHGAVDVNEELLIKVCQEVTPEQYQEKTLAILHEYKTK